MSGRERGGRERCTANDNDIALFCLPRGVLKIYAANDLILVPLFFSPLFAITYSLNYGKLKLKPATETDPISVECRECLSHSLSILLCLFLSLCCGIFALTGPHSLRKRKRVSLVSSRWRHGALRAEIIAQIFLKYYEMTSVRFWKNSSCLFNGNW